MKLQKIKITEVVQILRTRVVEVELPEGIIYKKGEIFDMDKNFLNTLNVITSLVRNQHSTENDLTEQVIKAEIL